MECSEIQGPVLIGEDTTIRDSVIGPHASIGQGCLIASSSLEYSVVLDGVQIEGIKGIESSLLGRNSIIRRDSESHHSMRLTIGEDTEVIF